MNELILKKQEHFGDIQVDLYSDNEDIFMTIAQLAECLGYANGRKGIDTLLERNPYLKDIEFSVTLKLRSTDGKMYETRVFNEDGIYEVTMLAKTEKAKEFRSWVRKILKSLRKGETGLVSAEQIKELEGQIGEIKKFLSASGKYLKRIDDSTKTTKYFVLRNQSAKKNGKWVKKIKPQVKALAERLEIDGYKVLNGIYIEISDRYNIDLNDYRSDYCYINNVGECSMLNVIESNHELLNYFEAVLAEMLIRFGVYVEASVPKRKTVFDEVEETFQEEN